MKKTKLKFLFSQTLFSIKTPTYRKNAYSKILYMFREIDKNIIRKFGTVVTKLKRNNLRLRKNGTKRQKVKMRIFLLNYLRYGAQLNL